MLTVCNIFLLLANLYSIGLANKKMEIIEDKLEDMSMLEKRVAHICDNMDSAFFV